MSKISLHLTNQEEFEREFNRYPNLYEMFGKKTLDKLQKEIEDAGTQDCIFISTSHSQYSVFEFIHEQGADVYYTFVTRVSSAR